MKHAEKADAGLPLSDTFRKHTLALMQSDARNPEVQNRYAALLGPEPEKRRTGPSISFSGNEANPFFHNTGTGFVEVGTTLGLSRIEDGRGLVLVDLDQDGALDVVLHNHFRNPVVALLNRMESGNHWVRFRLRGTRSNRFGIGARVTVIAAGVRPQVQELSCGSGFVSGNAPELHFGIGKAERVDVSVRWPSGQVDRLSGLDADRIHTLVEGDPKASRAEAPKPAVIRPDPVASRPAEPDIRALLRDLRTLGGQTAAVAEGREPLIAVFFSVDCQACGEDLQRRLEIERRAAEAGARLVWVTVDADLAKAEAGFRRADSPVLPLRAEPLPTGLQVPCVYLLRAGRAEKFMGRHAVTAALQEAARLGK